MKLQKGLLMTEVQLEVLKEQASKTENLEMHMCFQLPESWRLDAE